ncbi:MAG: hypothetical protein ACI364_06815 [Coriobacteriales bacterium]
MGQSSYPDGVTERDAAWNLPDRWRGETCGTCYYLCALRHEDTSATETVCVLRVGSRELWSRDRRHAACEYWEER